MLISFVINVCLLIARTFRIFYFYFWPFACGFSEIKSEQIQRLFKRKETDTRNTLHMSANCTHVSDSLKSESITSESVKAEGSVDDDRAAKNRMVVHYIVDSLMADKKRKLAKEIDEELGRAVVQRKVPFECGCACSLVPCAKKVAMREEYRRKVAHKVWPKLEKEFVEDVANALWTSRRSNEWLSKELEAVTKENTVLKRRLSVVASAF